MIRAKYLHPTYLLRGEVPVAEKRLAELEAKERAHDAYIEATRHMRARLESLQQQRGGIGDREQGYQDCMRDFSLAVVEAARRAA